MQTQEPTDIHTGAVVTVGGGRGFVVASDSDDRRYILTAAHCLPKLPAAMPAQFEEDKTYKRLVGRLGDRPSVWACCLFVDPLSDVAVLCEPDGEVYDAQEDAYHEFVSERLVTPLRLAPKVDGATRAWALSLDGRWRSGECLPAPPSWHPEAIRFVHCTVPIEFGMSGSPILDEYGRAVALVSGGSCTSLEDDAPSTSGDGVQPVLWQCLPGWFMRAKSVLLHPS